MKKEWAQDTLKERPAQGCSLLLEASAQPPATIGWRLEKQFSVLRGLFRTQDEVSGTENVFSANLNTNRLLQGKYFSPTLDSLVLPEKSGAEEGGLKEYVH